MEIEQHVLGVDKAVLIVTFTIIGVVFGGIIAAGIGN